MLANWFQDGCGSTANSSVMFEELNSHDDVMCGSRIWHGPARVLQHENLSASSSDARASPSRNGTNRLQQVCLNGKSKTRGKETPAAVFELQVECPEMWPALVGKFSVWKRYSVLRTLHKSMKDRLVRLFFRQRE